MKKNRTTLLATFVALSLSLMSGALAQNAGEDARDAKTITTELKDARQALVQARRELNQFVAKNKLQQDEALTTLQKEMGVANQGIADYRLQFAASLEGGKALVDKLQALQAEIAAMDKKDKEAYKAKQTELATVLKEINQLVNKGGINKDEKVKTLGQERNELAEKIVDRMLEVAAAHSAEGSAIADSYKAAEARIETLGEELTELKATEAAARKAKQAAPKAKQGKAKK